MTTTALIQQPTTLVQQQQWMTLLPPALQLAEVLAKATEFVPKDLRGRKEAIAAAILTGQELGIPPMTALANIAVIEGKPSVSALAQRALVFSHGHEITFVGCNSQRATARGRRRGSQEWTEVTWSMDDAKRARLDGRPNWQRFPGDMLVARASAKLCRLIFADVLGGMPYTTEELEDGLDTVDAPEQAGDTEASTTTRRRRRRAEPELTALPGGVEVVGAEPPLPDPEPEAPATVNGATPRMPVPPAPAAAGETQPTGQSPARKRMHALFRNAGIDDRDARLSLAVAVIRREISSSAAMTDAEVDSVANVLDDHVEGRRPLGRDERGQWLIGVDLGGNTDDVEEPEIPLPDEDEF